MDWQDRFTRLIIGGPPGAGNKVAINCLYIHSVIDSPRRQSDQRAPRPQLRRQWLGPVIHLAACQTVDGKRITLQMHEPIDPDAVRDTFIDALDGHKVVQGHSFFAFDTVVYDIARFHRFNLAGMETPAPVVQIP